MHFLDIAWDLVAYRFLLWDLAQWWRKPEKFEIIIGVLFQ